MGSDLELRKIRNSRSDPTWTVVLDERVRQASNRAMKRSAALVIAVALAMPAPAVAQSPNSADSNADRQPVSLARIKRGLREKPTTPLRLSDRVLLSYYVSVVGESPPIDVFKDFDTRRGAVAFSAPTHQELFYQVTPQEFRAPAADILGAARWIKTKLPKKRADGDEK
jgi:hypothetical protein